MEILKKLFRLIPVEMCHYELFLKCRRAIIGMCTNENMRYQFAYTQHVEIEKKKKKKEKQQNTANGTRIAVSKKKQTDLSQYAY